MQEIDFVMLGNRLAAARRLQGIRQYELAERTGVHPVTLSRLEHGNLPGVTLAVIARVAMTLGLSIDAILGWQPQEASVTPPPRGQARRPRQAVPMASAAALP